MSTATRSIHEPLGLFLQTPWQTCAWMGLQIRTMEPEQVFAAAEKIMEITKRERRRQGKTLQNYLHDLTHLEMEALREKI